MEIKYVEILLEIREIGKNSPEVGLLETLLIQWDNGQWKVTNPEGPPAWVGRHESQRGAILDYFRERLAIPAPSQPSHP